MSFDDIPYSETEDEPQLFSAQAGAGSRPSAIQALAALALGAAAFGAAAIGALAIGRLAIGRMRVGRLDVEHLWIGRVEGPGAKRLLDAES